MRTASDLNLKKSIKTLYCALIHPILEYGSIVLIRILLTAITQ